MPSFVIDYFELPTSAMEKSSAFFPCRVVRVSLQHVELPVAHEEQEADSIREASNVPANVTDYESSGGRRARALR